MKTRVYHGTSADNLKSILKSGLKSDCDKIWTPSENAVYCWNGNALVESGDCEEDYKETYAFNRAFSSAQCSLSKAIDCRAIIVVAEIEESELEVDYSCKNMTNARCINRCIKKSEIIEIHVSNDLSLLRGYFIGLMMHREFNNLEFNQIEMMIGEKLIEVVYPEDIDEFTTFERVK